jgi:hypothetical protein
MTRHLVGQLLLASLLILVARAAVAQETFFQVPNGDVPEARQLRSQLQAGLGKELDVNGTVVVGLGRAIELGVSLHNLEFEHRAGRVALADNAAPPEPYAPLLLLVAQQRYELREWFALGVGVQMGSNLAQREDVAFVARAYALAVFDFAQCGRCALGPYVASASFLGDQQRVGGFAGCEIELMPDLFGVEADWDAGAHALGALSLGPRVHLGKCCALTAGVQIPNAWGSASYRALTQFELTYPGKQE